MKKATNSALMRVKNQKIILSLINKKPISRVDLAKKTGLTKAAVTIIIDELKQKNIINEQSEKTNSIGRNPVLLTLNPSAVYMAAVNITRLDITVGITDLAGNIVAKDTFPICNPEEAFQRIQQIFNRQIAENKIDISKIHKLSVASPGPVDVEKGIILNPPNFKSWHNIPIASKLRELTGLEVLLGNVSSANAMAEKYFGSAHNSDNFLVLQIDEGIGSGIFLNDTLFTGPCELGHISIKYDGIKCTCGNRGCLEKYASIPQILKNSGFKSWQEVVDNNSKIILEKQADYLSTAITSANNLFNFDKIVINGELAYKPEKITKLISEKLKHIKLSDKEVTVCAGMIKSKLKIAVSIAIHDFFN
ncbi:MAG: ROK family transcriptional regulator [Clostridia bacterium]|nr:ROK family transcriptional regulator [Clostridia bacterium]